MKSVVENVNTIAGQTNRVIGYARILTATMRVFGPITKIGVLILRKDR